MRLLPNKLGRFAGACISPLLLIFVATSANVLAQNAPPPGGQSPATESPAGCDTPIKPTEANLTVGPDRGWQMEGRDIKLAVTSGRLTGNVRPLVCFRWQLRGGQGKF